MIRGSWWPTSPQRTACGRLWGRDCGPWKPPPPSDSSPNSTLLVQPSLITLFHISIPPHLTPDSVHPSSIFVLSICIHTSYYIYSKIVFMRLVFKVFMEFCHNIASAYVLIFWPQDMWVLAAPPGMEQVPAALEGRVLTTAPPGKALYILFVVFIFCLPPPESEVHTDCSFYWVCSGARSSHQEKCQERSRCSINTGE